MPYKEVWLAIRTDSIPGDGTPGNPFDASTADLFDGKMNDFFDDSPNKYYIHLEPGLYFTRGGKVTSGSVTKGWNIGNGWMVAGAGVGATIVQLSEFTFPSAGGKRSVITGVPTDNIRNVVVRDMTIDANWPNLGENKPSATAVSAIGINAFGNATVENVRAINTYGDRGSQNECFSIFLSHADNLDSNDPVAERSTLAIRNCIAEDGRGNYVVGMTAFSLHMVDMRGNVCRNLPNGSPPSPGYPYGMSPSAAYQFTGRGIIFTENQSYNCPAPLYFDTGNIRDVLIANNAFFGCRWAGLLSYPGSASFFAINVRQAGASLDGKYVDIPVKPSGGSDSYRVRLWFSYNGSTTNQPPAPATGHRLAVNYSSSDTTTVEGNARDALANDTTQGGLFSSGSLGFGCALSSPKPGVGAWAGTAVPTVSNPSYLYAQRGYEFQNWVVNSNLFEIVMADWDGQQWVPYFTAQQYGVYLQGNGADSCKDFVVSNNQVFFNPPNYVNQNQVIGYQTWGLAGHLSITDNHVDYVAGYRGGADIQVLSGATRHVFGNRTTGPTPGMPIPGLEDLSAPPFRVYDLFTDGSNYRLGRCSWVLGDFQIETVAAGTGITGLGNLVLKTAATKQIRLYGGASGANIWNFDASGSFFPGASNTYDVGSSSNMVRNLYVSIVSPGNNVFDLDLKTAAGKQMRFFGGSSGAQIWSFDSGGHLVAGTGSEMIKWGTTPGSNYPALKRSGVELHVRRADDSGGAPLVYPLAISAKTTSYTITAAEGNRCFTNAGAAAGVTFTLPDASPANVGFHCRFLIEAAQTLTVQANGSNFIRIGTALSGSHGSAATSTIGNTLHLICTQSGIWVALGHDGNWTVTQPSHLAITPPNPENRRT